MGRKHWITGRVRTSRYGGRYVNTYTNTAGQKFQAGTPYEFNEPTFPDEERSEDCGIGAVTIDVSEAGAYYADANGQVKDITPGGDPEVYTLNNTDVATYTLYRGDTFSAEAFCEFPSTGSNPLIWMEVLKNGIVVYLLTSTPAVPGASLLWVDPVPIAEDDDYQVTIYTTVEDPVAPVACGVEAAYSGGESFPTDTIITLGSGLGNVTLSYDAFGIPDKFEVWFEGVKVIDTGYRGDSSQQSALDAALAARGLPSEPIVGTGAGTASFNKTSPATTALVKVYAPISGTAWNFTLGCPA